MSTLANYFFSEKEASHSIQDLDKSMFFQGGGGVPNLGISSAIHWVMIDVYNDTEYASPILEIPQSDIGELRLFDFEQKTQIAISGKYFPFSSRKLKHHYHRFQLPLKPGEQRTFLLRVHSLNQITLPMAIGHRTAFVKTDYVQDILFGIYAGMMIVMFFYNLFIYISTQDRTYLLYVTYILFVTLVQASIIGYANVILWSQSVWLTKKSVTILSCLSAISAVAFVKVFLDVKNRIPFWSRIGVIVIGMYLALLLLSVFIEHELIYQFVLINAVIGSVYLLTVGIVLAVRGLRVAKFFLTAWSFFLIGLIIFVLKDYDILPFNNLTRLMMPVGTAVEVVLLSLALADRIKILKKDKESYQAQTIAMLEEKERSAAQKNVELARLVDQRTHDLKTSNEELRASNENLKTARSKMATLGQLTAGIAHDIRNPLNVISLSFMPIYAKLDGSSELLNNRGDKDNTLITNMAEVRNLVQGIDDSTRRVIEIVNTLRAYSKKDKVREQISIKGIADRAIELIGYQRGVTEIRNEIAPEILMECYPARLTQLFLNLIMNSLQAIDLKENEEKGLIVLNGNSDNNTIFVTIQDNGIGIPEKVQPKVFDLLFTTKENGSGLGLSEVKEIVEEHGGSVSFESHYGITSFTVSFDN